MKSFLHSMDQHTQKNIGENGHIQNNWSNVIKSKIPELYFQLVRCEDHTNLKKQWLQILSSFDGLEKQKIDDLKLIVKLVANVRDIKNGKGEQKLAFMLLFTMWDFYPELAKFIFIKYLMMDNDEHCLGSLKDIKYFWSYIKNESKNENHPFINYILNICVDILKREENNFMLKKPLSLFCKWFPREKSKKFGWINVKFSMIYYSYIMCTAKTLNQKERAKKKCISTMRKLLAKINKQLDTSQIKMANKTWSEIDFNKVTGPTLRIHKYAFQNKNKNGTERTNEFDRIECSKNLKKYLQDATEGKIKVKSKTVEMYKLVKDALTATTPEDIELVNQQWKTHSDINKELDRFIIPMSDVSYSMTDDNYIPLYNSIGYGIRVSEKTHPDFRNRIMTFSNKPSWIQLSDNLTFHQKVQIVKNDKNWSGNTNFYKALEMILEVCINNNIPPSDVEKMILVIFSDMQINLAIGSLNMATMMENIKLLYSEAGLKSVWKKPFPVPHIMFWNLRKTEGFPSTTYETNTSMVSGYNPVLLNTFVNKGTKELKKVTPYIFLQSILNNQKYNIFDEFVDKYFS